MVRNLKRAPGDLHGVSGVYEKKGNNSISGRGWTGVTNGTSCQLGPCGCGPPPVWASTVIDTTAS